MSVLSCVRNYCESIMCDTYIPGIGYVCFKCQKEFKVFLSNKGYGVNSDLEIESHLGEFLELSSTDNFVSVDNLVEEFFQRHTD